MHAGDKAMARRFLLVVSALLLVFFFYESVLRTLFASLPDLAGGVRGQSLVLVGFSLLHALHGLGWRRTLFFFVTTAVVSWAFEQVGVSTGIVYGAYHYTDALGIRLGHVPVLIPLAWFMMVYPSYIVANLTAGRRPYGSPRRIGAVAGMAALSALAMTAWDVVMDPLMSGPTVGAWVWENGGPYFGIPLRNFAGWLVTTFVISFVYRLFDSGSRRAPAEPAPAVAAMPLIAYASVMFATSLSGTRPEMVVIGLFAMGAPLAAAITGLARGSAGSAA